MITQTQIDKLVEALHSYEPNLQTLYLFGSRAGDPKYIHPESDYDLAFSADGIEPLPVRSRLRLIVTFMDILCTDAVDLIDMRGVSAHLLRMAIIDGKRLYTRDQSEAYVVEAKWITMANDFAISERILRQHQLDQFRQFAKP